MIRKGSSTYKDPRKFQMIGKIDPEPFGKTQEGSITFLKDLESRNDPKRFQIV